MNTFAERLKYTRTKKHLTQNALAEKAELSKEYIGVMERGKITPKIKTVQRLANALNVNSDWLMGKTDSAIKSAA